MSDLHEYAVDYTVDTPESRAAGYRPVREISVRVPFYVNVNSYEKLCPVIEAKLGLPSGSVRVCHALLQGEPR